MQHKDKCFWCMGNIAEDVEITAMRMKSDIETMRLDIEEVSFCSNVCCAQFEEMGAIYI